jgi:hypothetical protein
MTQTMIEMLEAEFEPVTKKNARPTTLANAVSNELMKIMPRISPELLERKRTAQVNLSKKQIADINEWYKYAREESSWNERFMHPKRLCSAEIPIFAYAKVPEQTEIVYEKQGIVTYEDIFRFSTKDVYVKLETKGGCWKWDEMPGQKYAGTSVVEVRSVWTAPDTLNVCVKVPEIPQEVINLGDEALLQYFTTAKSLRASFKTAGIQKPRLGVLWAPTDESLYIAGDISQAPAKDPVLVLSVPDGEKNYQHVIASWNIGEERPFKHWLAEYTA